MRSSIIAAVNMHIYTHLHTFLVYLVYNNVYKRLFCACMYATDGREDNVCVYERRKMKTKSWLQYRNGTSLCVRSYRLGNTCRWSCKMAASPGLGVRLEQRLKVKIGTYDLSILKYHHGYYSSGIYGQF